MRNKPGSLENQLRSIVIHSGDCAPNTIREYLRHLAAQGTDEAKKQTYTNFAPLIQAVPHEYVDFLLEILLQRLKKRNSSVAGPAPDDENEFDNSSDYYGEFYHDYDLDKPTYDKGPFLTLLRLNEEEGLRFLWTYTNALTDRWIDRVKHPRSYSSHSEDTPLTPVPLSLELPSKTILFWGDAQVYFWPHDENRDLPGPLVSALLALEYWIEEEIEKGRDVWALIEKVLNGSRCVAILGLCFGVMLAYLEQVWDHVLPFVTNSRLWRLERARFESQILMAPFRGRHVGANPDRNNLKDRVNRPQRWCDIRNLATRLELSESCIRQAFRDAVLSFPIDPLPFQWQEEAEDKHDVMILRERMEEFAAFADRSFYLFHQVSETGASIEVILPPHIEQARRDRYGFLFEAQEAQALVTWARETISKSQVSNYKTLDQAVDEAKKLSQPGDFTYSYEWRRDMVNARHEAQVAVAAALTQVSWEWACENGHSQWCLSILQLASTAKMPHDPHNKKRPACIIIDHPKLFAAHGWAALAVRSEAIGGDSSIIPLKLVRENLLRLACLHDNYIWEAIWEGLAPLWSENEKVSPPWLWGLLNFAVASTFIPHPANIYNQDSQKNVKDYLRLIKRRFKPSIVNNTSQVELLALSATAEPNDTIVEIIETIPLASLKENAFNRLKIIELVKCFIDWIVLRYSSYDSSRRREIRRGHESETNDTHEVTKLLRWCVAVADYLTESEVESLLIEPIWSLWTTVPGLTEELLHAHAYHWIRSQSKPSSTTQHMWRTLCLRVLQCSEVKVVSRYHHRNIEGALNHVLFVSSGSCWLDKDYPHALLFTDIFDSWVKQVGHKEDCFPHLLTFLESQGERFSPQPMLDWMIVCFEEDGGRNASHLLKSAREAPENARRVANLVHYAFVQLEEEGPFCQELIQKFSMIIDPLIDAGQAPAALLRNRIIDLQNTE